MRTWKSNAPFTAALVAGLFSASVSAVIPDSGWYSNPAESGRGFNIEIQNNTLFMAGFMYDPSGRQLWVVSGGLMSTDRTYTGSAIVTSSGQPLGGSYNAPTVVPFGTASVTFPTTTTANITVNGYSFCVTRELFGFDFSSTAQPLLGELLFVEGLFGAYFANRIVFTGTQVSSTDGSLFAVGHTTGDTTRLAVGSYAPSLQKWTILLDSSASYYDYFVFAFEGLNLVEGNDSTYLKGTSPSGSLPMIGFRTKSAQAAAGFNAPGTINMEMVRPSMGSDSYSAAKAAAQVAKPLPQSQVESLRALEYVLQGALQRQ